MFTLELERFFTPCFSKVPSEVLEDFKAPMAFYLCHKSDSSRTLIDACVAHFGERKIEHLNLMTPSNVRSLATSDTGSKYVSSGFFHPHCSIFEPSKNRHLVFSELSTFFYRMDPDAGKCDLVRGEDALPGWASENTLFWATFATDETERGTFHMTASRDSGEKLEIGIFEIGSDFSEGSPVGTVDSPTNFCPHMTRKVGRKLFNSNFYNVRYSLFGWRLKVYRPELYETVFRKLFEDFSSIRGEESSDSRFFANFKQGMPFPVLSKPFEEYYRSVLKKEEFPDFLRLSEKKYGLEILPGSFFTYDLDTKEATEYPTSLPTPAHFEMSVSWDAYVSCHNFLTFENIQLLWPAAIDRFERSGDGFRFVGSASHPTGYRFTSHKVFEWKGKTKICTIWQTERLFVFDAETMELDFYRDLDPHYAQMSDSARFGEPPINSIGPIGAFEISASWRYAFVFSHLGMGIFDFETRSLLGGYEKVAGTTPGGYELSDFYKKSAHCQYLDADYRI